MEGSFAQRCFEILGRHKSRGKVPFFVDELFAKKEGVVTPLRMMVPNLLPKIQNPVTDSCRGSRCRADLERNVGPNPLNVSRLVGTSRRRQLTIVGFDAIVLVLPTRTQLHAVLV